MNNKLTDDVGKKIVEALKKQSDIEIQQVVDTPVVEEENVTNEEETSNIEFVNDPSQEVQSTLEETHNQEPKYNIPPAYNGIGFYEKHQGMMYGSAHMPLDGESLTSELEGFDIPTNVAVLKQLIGQLPSGVTKQTGAQIIRQTMEALGIPMKSVLQEAQQVQESLTNSSRECQASIMEYKRQIGVLEKQSQKFQKQYAALNDIISLFLQTGN